MHPLASETVLSAKAISLKIQGNERESKMRDTTSNDMFESYSSCLKNISFPREKKFEKAFMHCCQRYHSSLAALLKEE